MECLQHLATLADDYKRLVDLHLRPTAGAAGVPASVYPVHSAILARWSGLARSLLSAIEDGVAQAGGCGGSVAVGAALGAPLSSIPDSDACAFLAALYALPSQQALAEVLCSMRRDTESGDIVFDFAIEPVLKLAKAYDCPELFQLADQALCSDPLLKLAVLMAPLRWLLLFDEYAHMGYFPNARAAAISHLSAKFSAVQNDPLLATLSPASLLDLTRMMAFRLSTLAQSCGHVRAVQDRSLQRFTALAQEVAAPYCPDPRRANAFVTNWAVSTVSRSIKLSWLVDPAAAAQAQAAQAEHAAPPPPQPAQPIAFQPAPSLMPPQPAAAPPPQPLPSVQLPANWQLGPAAQAALSQQRAAVTALMAQMQEERMQQLELLAGQAEMRAEELAAAQAAVAAGGASSHAEAEAAAAEQEEGVGEDEGLEEDEEEVEEEIEEEEEEEECEDSHQDAEQEWAAGQEAAAAASAAASGPRALPASAVRVHAEEDAAADSNHASPTRHSPNMLWRDSLPSLVRLPPLRLSPKSAQQQQQQQQGAASGASRHTAHGGRRYAPY